MVFYSGKIISNKSVRNLWSNPVSQSHVDSMSQLSSKWKNSTNLKYLHLRYDSGANPKYNQQNLMFLKK